MKKKRFPTKRLARVKPKAKKKGQFLSKETKMAAKDQTEEWPCTFIKERRASRCVMPASHRTGDRERLSLSLSLSRSSTKINPTGRIDVAAGRASRRLPPETLRPTTTSARSIAIDLRSTIFFCRPLSLSLSLFLISKPSWCTCPVCVCVCVRLSVCM